MIEWLIDNADAYTALVRVIQGARASVWMTQLALDADCVAYGDPPTGDKLLLDALLGAAAIADVRILLNATLLLDTSRPLLRALRARAGSGRGLAIRGVRKFPQLLHAKLVIVDGTNAFLLGSPFVNGYWDNAHHVPVDARRPLRELGGRPLHDVSVAFDGPAVNACVQLFDQLWELGDEHASPTPAARVVPRRTAAPGDQVDIVTTSPARALHSTPSGSTDTLDALLDGIRSARRFIYIEHQYLSSRRVVLALAEAVDREPELEIIMVLNQNPDVTAYRAWQALRLHSSGLLGHPRVGLFALWSSRASKPKHELTQIFVHSKVVIVDDTWALVGSANLDGVSLHSYGDDFSGLLARRVFRDVRNFDIGIVIREGTAGEQPAGKIRELRERLWCEHLGVGAGEVLIGAEGALSHWRAAAAWNVQALNDAANDLALNDLANVQALNDPANDPAVSHPAWNDPRATLMRGFVLPFSLLARPAEQLEDVGVREPAARLNLCFNPGWLEINFSPNWVRNMFL